MREDAREGNENNVEHELMKRESEQREEGTLRNPPVSDSARTPLGPAGETIGVCSLPFSKYVTNMLNQCSPRWMGMDM